MRTMCHVLPTLLHPVPTLVSSATPSSHTLPLSPLSSITSSPTYTRTRVTSPSTNSMIPCVGISRAYISCGIMSCDSRWGWMGVSQGRRHIGSRVLDWERGMKRYVDVYEWMCRCGCGGARGGVMRRDVNRGAACLLHPRHMIMSS